MDALTTAQVRWQPCYRIVASRFPPISLFEDVADPADLEAVYAIEAMTNDRLRQEVGDISLVPVEDRVVGPGSTPIMAAFTHLNPLDRDALRRILTEPKNSLIKQYIELFKIDGITLKFTEDTFDYIVDKAIEFKLGARGLRSICEAIMLNVMFEAPSKKMKTLTIDKTFAEKQFAQTELKHILNA